MSGRTGHGLVKAACASGLMLSCAQHLPPSRPPAQPLPTPATCQREPQVDPLVTEWPASEKARLASLLAQQPVAVRYDGCELQILDACRLPGGYAWRHTTPVADSLRIDSKRELAERLPLGGVRLESVLEREGSLSILTTVSGRYELADSRLIAPELGPCESATHLVQAMSVGTFRLVGGGTARSDASLGAAGVEVAARVQRSERLIREAGVAEACADGTGSGPARQCASPIRLHLAPLERERPKSRAEQARRAGEVLVHIPLAPDAGGRWALHDGSGKFVCELPCSLWMRPEAGYSLSASASLVGPPEVIPLTGGFPVAPGARALGVYRPQRGSPAWSSTAFWVVGAPSLILGGLFLLGTALSQQSGEEIDSPLLGYGLGLTATGAGLWWWYSWSEEASFEVRALPREGSRSASDASRGIALGAGFAGGTF